MAWETARLRAWAAALSIGAALVHAAVTEEHLNEWWAYGVFFLLAAFGQAFYGLLLLLRPWNKPADPAGSQARERAWLWVGVATNGFLVLLYVASRTLGVPLGPDAGRVEDVTPAGLIAKALEVALVTLLVLLLRLASPRGPPTPGRA